MALRKDESWQLCRAVGDRAGAQAAQWWIGGRAGPAPGYLGLSAWPAPGCVCSGVAGSVPGKTALPVLPALPPGTDPGHFSANSALH